MPYGITQCYLPPGRGDIPALTPAEAGTRLSDPGGIQGWVDQDGIHKVTKSRYYPGWTVNSGNFLCFICVITVDVTGDIGTSQSSWQQRPTRVTQVQVLGFTGFCQVHFTVCVLCRCSVQPFLLQHWLLHVRYFTFFCNNNHVLVVMCSTVVFPAVSASLS